MALVRERRRARPDAVASAPAALDRLGVLPELAAIASATAAYFLANDLIRGRAHMAILSGRDILAFEQTYHLAPEQALHSLGLRYPWLLDWATLLYFAGHLPLLFAVAVWLYRSNRAAYPWFRNTFLISALVGFAVYIVLPVAPPRLLPGFVGNIGDTMSDAMGDPLGGSALGRSVLDALVDPYGAMPSLHVAWAFLAGTALALRAHPRWVRLAGGLWPLLMILVVLVTANHYLLDTVAGLALAVGSLAAAASLTRLTHARPG